MSRMVAKITIQSVRHVALYCNTIDNIVSPTFTEPADFYEWLETKWTEHDNDGYWTNEARVWLDHGV